MYPWKIIFMLWVSGSGKNTMIHELLKTDLPLKQLISYKTRPLREGEVDGVDYHCMTQEQFQAAADAWEFLEYEQNYGMHWYATGKKEVIDALQEGKILIKEMDIKGLQEIHDRHPDVWSVTKSVFLDVNEETMIQRIHKRGAIADEDLQWRLQTAAGERALAHKYCTDIVDASGTIEEEFARVYAVVARYCEKPAEFISPVAI